MPRITDVRPVLLSVPYASEDNLEVRVHLRSGMRTCGMVQITLEDGTTGLGEGYLAVFAPRVFEEIVRLVAPCLIGREASDIHARYADLCKVTGYWSLQGAARHVLAACEIALVDAVAKALGVPACSLFGGRTVDSLQLYGSGGDSPGPALMQQEIELLGPLGIELFKIRARNFEAAKTAWTLERAAAAGIRVGVDMCQNLANPAQTVAQVLLFLEEVSARTSRRVAFLEEPLGPMDIENYSLLRGRATTPICGGEIITTAAEMCRRAARGMYDFVQPDATVIGGIGQVREVFQSCAHYGVETVVHCWGGPVGMMANYHAAFACGGRLAEWPMPQYPLRSEMLVEPLRIERGRLLAPSAPGLGVHLTPGLEKKYRFREDAVYSCLAGVQPDLFNDPWE